jgi:RND family efflux transporter MFP subunit
MTYERQKRLWDQNIGSEMQYLQVKNQKERLEKSIETVRFQLTKSKIYATATGEITRTMVKSGDVISPGMPLFEVLNLSRVQVHAEVPENYLGSVKKGQTVKVTFPALEKETTAKITLIGQKVNPANRTFKVEIDMPNSGNLKPNLLATISLKDFEKKDVVVLPSELVQQEVSGKSYVFVQDEGAKGLIAKKIYVTIEEAYQGGMYISEGLTGDEIFILKGSRDLKDGELIEVK